MGGYNDLKTAITALIRTNDNQEITGATLQSALLSIINTIGQGSVFKGVATTSTNPGSPDANVFYIAGRPGYYPNFNLELTAGLHVIENKSGTWVNTEIVLDVVDAINIGGAKHVKPSQAMIINLQSTEQIPDSEGLNNKMWWSTDGNLKYKQNDTVYNLGAPAYVLYYCGDQIYKWIGSGFREIGGGGTFASGEAVSSMSIFDDGSDTDGKSSAQLAAMIPSGEVIKSLLQLISSIDTSGGSYDGVDLITTFSYDAPTRVITVKQSGRQAKTILLPLANSTNAGLMSSEDKTQLANMQNLIGKTVNSFSKSTGETGITITLVTSNGTPHAVLIPIDSELSSQSTSNLVTGAAIYNFLMSDFVYLDQDGRVYAPYTRILPLVSMGSALDNDNTPAQINTNEFRYDPTTKRIYRHNTSSAQPYFMPSTSQLYLNICTGKMYKWAGSDMEEISGGADPSTLAGKADKHVAADILAPSQWPRVMLYNIESMWGAGGTPPDYSSIPVGSIYLDEPDSADDPPYKRLFYKKTLEGTSQRIDLGAPQENTIYCHIATGKLYRWVPTQNGNDGAFQQIGGSGTVTGVSVNNGQVNTPDQNGVINLNIQIPQSGLQQSDIDIETQEDGTIDVTVGTNQYNINLNHTHENMAKLIVCEESDLPSTLDPATIYAITDSGETEIEKLIIRGMEFAGGGAASTDPRLISPRNGITLDFDGQSTMQVLVLCNDYITTALTIAVTGDFTVTAGGSSVSSISAADAKTGVLLTLTKGSNFTYGTLVISSSTSEFDAATLSVRDTAGMIPITAVKFTGEQWLETDYYPNPDTEFELDCKFEVNSNSTKNEGKRLYIFSCAHEGDNRFNFLVGSHESNNFNEYRLACYNNVVSVREEIRAFQNNNAGMLVRSVFSYTKAANGTNMVMSFNGESNTNLPLKTNTMLSKLALCYSYYFQDVFSQFNLYVYSLKIKENGTIVRNYSPMSRNSVPGLYESVSGQFISSKTGTELFAISE